MLNNLFIIQKQSKSKTQYQEVCMISSIVLLLTLIEHNIEFFQLEFHYNFIILGRYIYLFNLANAFYDLFLHGNYLGNSAMS